MVEPTGLDVELECIAVLPLQDKVVRALPSMVVAPWPDFWGITLPGSPLWLCSPTLVLSLGHLVADTGYAWRWFWLLNKGFALSKDPLLSPRPNPGICGTPALGYILGLYLPSCLSFQCLRKTLQRPALPLWFLLSDRFWVHLLFWALLICITTFKKKEQSISSRNFGKEPWMCGLNKSVENLVFLVDFSLPVWSLTRAQASDHSFYQGVSVEVFCWIFGLL